MTARRGLANFLRQVQVDDWVSPAVDAVEGEAERWGPPRLTIHPSGAGGCARDIQLGMLGHRTVVHPQNQMRMDNGSDAHRRWEARMARTTLLAGARLRLVELVDGQALLNPTADQRPDPSAEFWSGELDLLLERRRERFVTEVKTMNAFRWRRVPAQDADHELMARRLFVTEPGYVRQLVQYVVKFGQHTPLVGGTGIFIFENTDSQEYKVRFIRPSDQLRQAAFAESITARTACVAGMLLEPPFRRGSQQCRTCYREALCYVAQDGDRDVLDVIEARLQEASGG